MTGSIFAVTTVANTDLSGGTAYQIRHALASKSVGGVIGTNAVNGLYGIAVLSDKAFVQTLVSRIDIKVVVGRTGAGRRGIVTGSTAAVADPEETDPGGLIGLVKLFKLKGGLRFGCACVCR